MLFNPGSSSVIACTEDGRGRAALSFHFVRDVSVPDVVNPGGCRLVC